MKRIISQGVLNQGNLDFMRVASSKIMKDSSKSSETFLETLKRASLTYERSRWDGLQSLNPPLGYIFVEPLSAEGILSSIKNNSNFLKEFNLDVEEISEKKDIMKDDCSIVEVPFEDIYYGKYNISLSIFEYTVDYKGNFEPVENPLILHYDVGLERLVNLEFDIK